MSKSYIYIFLLIDFILAQFYLIWDGQFSSNAHFAIFGGDVGWWVNMLDYKLRIFNALVFATVAGYHKRRLKFKDCLIIIVAYGYSVLKDVWDWYYNGNQGTKYIDWIIVIVLLASIEFFYEVTVNVFNDLRHKLKEWRNEQ